MSVKKKTKKKKKLCSQKESVALIARNHEIKVMFRRVIEMVGISDVYRLIPKSEWKFIHKIRFHSIRLKVAPGTEILKRVFKEYQKIFSLWMKKINIKMENCNACLNLEEALIAGMTFCLYGKHLEPDDFEGASQVKKAFSIFDQLLVDGIPLPVHKAFDLTENFVINESRISKGYVWFSVAQLPNNEDIRKTIFNLHMCNSKRAKGKIEGKSRSAFMIGFPASPEGMRWASVKLSDLGAGKEFSDAELPVFIQRHALDRLNERLSPIPEGVIHRELYYSIVKPVVVKDSKGRPLIEYRFAKFRLGYLTPHFFDNGTLITTFLFLTNTGTPEGNRIAEKLKLKAFEKRYLQIDRLNTFLDDNLVSDRKLRAVFSGCGCDWLFEFAQSYGTIQREPEHAEWIRKHLVMDNW